MPIPLITEYNFKESLSLQCEIIDLATLYEEHKEKLTSPHRASFYHILWFQDHATTHSADFENINIPANSLLFLNKSVVQQFSIVKAKGKALLFTDQFTAQHLDALTFLKSTVLFDDLLETAQVQLSAANAGIPILFDLMASEITQKDDSFKPALLLNYLHNLLQLSERSYRQQGFREIKKSVDLDYTLLFRDELESYYKSVRQVSHYAGLLNVSEKRLNAATTKVLAKTPKEIIDERVMLESKRLLAHTWLSVKEISYHLGFEEPTNFIKYFHKHSGKPPLEFREQFTN